MSKRIGTEPLDRLTVTMGRESIQHLKDEAKRRDLSVSEVLRGLVEEHLSTEGPRPLPAITGMFVDAPPDLSLRVDEVLDEIVAETFRRKMGYGIDQEPPHDH